MSLALNYTSMKLSDFKAINVTGGGNEMHFEIFKYCFLPFICQKMVINIKSTIFNCSSFLEEGSEGVILNFTLDFKQRSR